MTTVPIRCAEADCTEVVQVDKSRHDDADTLADLACARGHRFDFEKGRCPRRGCGHPLTEAGWRTPVAWFGNQGARKAPIFYPAECTNPACNYEGPK